MHSDNRFLKVESLFLPLTVIDVTLGTLLQHFVSRFFHVRNEDNNSFYSTELL